MRKKVLFMSYYKRHLEKMLPAIKALEAMGSFEVLTVLLTDEEISLAQAEKINYRPFDDYAEHKRKRKLWNLEWGLMPLINALDVEEPDLYITAEVNYIARDSVRHCRLKGIKSLVIQHGTPNCFSIHAFAPLEASEMAVWGQHTIDFLMTYGVPSEKMIITGSPLFEDVPKRKAEKPYVYEKLGIDPKKKLAVFTTQKPGPSDRPQLSEIRSSCNAVWAAFKKFKDWELVFQVHPQQAVEDVAEYVRDSDAKILKYESTLDLIASSDLMITFFSTTAIDAVAAGTELVLINLVDDIEFFPFGRMGAAWDIRNEAEIPAILSKAVNSTIPDVTKKKALEYVAGPQDGKSLERTISVITGMLDD